jgi:UDP-3-O-[3-hydroxymyristoyl] glucosamine N-acyltransferase
VGLKPLLGKALTPFTELGGAYRVWGVTSIELPTTAAAVGAFFSAEILGDPEAAVSRLGALNGASAGTLTFFANPKYADQLNGLSGAVVLTRADLVRPDLPVTFLLVQDPQASFAKVAKHFRPAFPWSGISPLAVVSPSAEIHLTAHIAPYACIGDGAKIGAGSFVYPFAYVGRAVVLGQDCELHPRCTLYDGVRLGNRVKVFSGAVLGSDGFGFFQETPKGPYVEMPQIGNVVIDDDVRIGANSTVDRATLGETRVRRGVKVDNLVHVGHNSDVGEDCILCAQVGLGGSGILENDVVLGGQVGLGHGVKVGSGARMGGQSGSTTNVPGAETYFFTPATPIRDFARIFRGLRKLPELLNRVRELEKRLGEKSDA